MTHRRAADDLFVMSVAFGVYLATLAPDVTTGDSGELITAAATWSLAHPTGYPLYLILGHAFVRAFGFLSPALAMNLSSAVAASGAVAIVRRLADVLTEDRLAAAATALLLAFSASFWSQATAARVYALGALLMALALFELRGRGQRPLPAVLPPPRRRISLRRRARDAGDQPTRRDADPPRSAPHLPHASARLRKPRARDTSGWPRVPPPARWSPVRGAPLAAGRARLVRGSSRARIAALPRSESRRQRAERESVPGQHLHDECTAAAVGR
ncbi:MAG: DUF2723 domain-containing protein [Deltaproteobacteria bacterium]|nr:MAG: DUF2723 domain-containing protein [Deltaproteobacteria bacterium]